MKSLHKVIVGTVDHSSREFGGGSKLGQRQVRKSVMTW